MNTSFLNPTYLMIFHFLFILISLSLLIYLYIKDFKYITMNYLAYFLIFSIFYISLPSIITVYTNFSIVDASSEIIRKSALYGFYFNLIIFCGFIFSLKINYKNSLWTYLDTIPHIRIKSIKVIFIVFLIIINLYISFIIIIHYNDFIQAYGDRRAQADLLQILINNYKINFLFFIIIIIISSLFFIKRSYLYFIYLLQFLFLDFILSDRDYILFIFILFVLLQSYNNKNIKIKYLFSLLFLFIFIGVYRGVSIDNIKIEKFFDFINEFLYTWANVHLTLTSTQEQDISNSMLYALFKIGLPHSYELLFGKYHHYVEIPAALNPFKTAGLAGSILAEVVSFKNKFMLFFEPLLIVMYGLFFNLLNQTKFITGKVLFILSIIYMFPIIRMGFFENALYIFYLVIFYNGLTVYIDLQLYKKIRLINKLKEDSSLKRIA